MRCDFEVAGVDSLVVRLGDEPSPALVQLIGSLTAGLRHQFRHQIKDIIPSYTTLLVQYDARLIGYDALTEAIAQWVSHAGDALDGDRATGKTLRLPVCYDPSLGLDLETLSQRLNIPMQEIVTRHSQVQYQVYAIGFSPGFGYLGTLDARLRVPRLDRPRTAVPAGSVAIAESHTAVYPQQTPGGWWIIGRCPERLFDPQRQDINLLQVGDRVVFEPIGLAAFHAYGGPH